MRVPAVVAALLGAAFLRLPAGLAQTAGPEAVTASPGDPPSAPELPITLPVVLRLAQLNTLDIAHAREVVSAAEAALFRAQVGWVPTFSLGSTYTHHEGTAQKTEGNIILTNKDSLFVGGGPSVRFGISEAVFRPLI